MKLLRLVWITTLIPLLVFSAGGFNVFVHFCHATGNKIVSLQGPESCEHDHLTDHNCHCEAGRCHAEIEQEHCCENLHYYIKTIDESSPACYDRICIRQIPVAVNIPQIEVIEPVLPLLAEAYRYCDYSSPPDHNASHLVIRYQTLKLDCC